MRIVYNPKDGAPITQWIFEGVKKDAHFPDGFDLKNGKQSNGLMQYTDFEAQSILETYEFLSEVTIDQAKAILERPIEPTFKCDFPSCEFIAKAKIGLEGHKRKHKLEVARDIKPMLDPSLIPISTGQKVLTPSQIQKMTDPTQDLDTKNGTDKDGVDWYGEGVVNENQLSPDSFGGMRAPGKGHFVG